MEGVTEVEATEMAVTDTWMAGEDTRSNAKDSPQSRRLIQDRRQIGQLRRHPPTDLVPLRPGRRRRRRRQQQRGRRGQRGGTEKLQRLMSPSEEKIKDSQLSTQSDNRPNLKGLNSRIPRLEESWLKIRGLPTRTKEKLTRGRR